MGKDPLIFYALYSFIPNFYRTHEKSLSNWFEYYLKYSYNLINIIINITILYNIIILLDPLNNLLNFAKTSEETIHIYDFLQNTIFHLLH